MQPASKVPTKFTRGVKEMYSTYIYKGELTSFAKETYLSYIYQGESTPSQVYSLLSFLRLMTGRLLRRPTYISMPISTCKKNVEVHPGCIVLGSQKPRWTRKQIEEDKAHAASATIAHKEDKEGCKRSIVEVEDAIERNEEQAYIYAYRPDLCYSRKPMPWPNSNGTNSEGDKIEEIPADIG
jgi:hypothetical protein